MAEYLGRGMRMIVAGLAPERIVVVGDLTRSWQRFGKTIEAQIQEQVLVSGCAPKLIPAFEDGMARLRGTGALVLQKHFSGGGSRAKALLRNNMLNFRQPLPSGRGSDALSERLAKLFLND